MSTTTSIVTGMNCGHCVSSVTEELIKVAGISAVAVDLATGAVTITSDGSVKADAVREAIDEAGYEAASA